MLSIKEELFQLGLKISVGHDDDAYSMAYQSDLPENSSVWDMMLYRLYNYEYLPS